MKTILITGHNGFVGRRLTAFLEKQGCKVVGIDLPDDITNIETLQKYNNYKIDHVFHLAAKTYVPDSWQVPFDFYKLNVLGTISILEFCRICKLPLTYVSAYAYGLPKRLPVAESDPLNPNNPYAHSKYLAEQVCKFYSDYYNQKVIVVRPFNIYGEGQEDKFLIPTIINQILFDESVIVTDLLPRRDYIYIDDLLEGIVATMIAKNDYAVYNLGSGYSLSVQEVIDIIQKVLKTNKTVKSKKQSRINELPDVFADITNVKNDLQWIPRYSFIDGITKTVAYYKNKE